MQELAIELEAMGSTARVVVADVTDLKRVVELVQSLDEELGGFDLVLANSGVGGTGASHELPFETLKRTVDVNLLGAMATLHAAASRMVARGHGTLAGMSSIAGQRGLPQSGAYSASKAGLTTWLDTLRSDLKSSGVTVTDIRPGFVRTPMTDENDFAMPFLMDVEPAARRCVDDLERCKAVCTFPAPMAWLMWLLHRIPDGLWRFMSPRIRR